MRLVGIRHYTTREEERARGEERGGGVQGAEKLKGFFYLLLNQLSTMQEIIKGDKKKGAGGGMGLWRGREEGRKGGREAERKRGGE